MASRPPRGSAALGRRSFLRGFGTLGFAAVGLRGRALRAEGDVQLRQVAAAPGRFMAWPANHGLWHWDGGREILVGHADGPWQEREGHNVGEPQLNVLARSLDGGWTWAREQPDPYVGSAGDRDPTAPPTPIRFDHPDLALRVVAGHAGEGEDRTGRFFLSFDRGRRWRGPFLFPGLAGEPRLAGLRTTSRTSYVVTGPGSLQILMSAQDPALGQHANRLDKPFVAETLDGGRSFRFVSWVVPWSDAYRAVMPATVRLPGGELVTALRRRDPRGPQEASWVDLYVSRDAGRSWSFRSRVGETGAHNGNPPALVLLRNGWLACGYGNRSRRVMLLRLSPDGGRSWGRERVARSNPFDYDLGYPQMVENDRGELVMVYYLATEERPQSYIEAALIRP
jgi:hypothetical protein